MIVQYRTRLMGTLAHIGKVAMIALPNFQLIRNDVQKQRTKEDIAVFKRLIALTLFLMTLSSTALATVEKGFTMYHGTREEKRLCITVDDLKDIEMVQAIFELGQQLNVPMTFFALGYVIEEKDAEVWRAIAASNCEIGNHTYAHQSLPMMGHINIIQSLQRVQDQLDEVLGYHYPMRVMRPPYGNITVNGSSSYVANAVDAAGYEHMVLWDVSQTNPEKCLKKVKNGSILLFHSIPKDLACLEILLPQLIEQGYEFVTVSEMAELSKGAETIK